MNNTPGKSHCLAITPRVRARVRFTTFVLALLAACGSGFPDRALAQPAGDTAAVPTPAVRPVVRELVEYDEYTGRFAPVNRVELRARVSGYLSKVAFSLGNNTFIKTCYSSFLIMR